VDGQSVDKIIRIYDHCGPTLTRGASFRRTPKNTWRSRLESALLTTTEGGCACAPIEGVVCYRPDKPGCAACGLLDPLKPRSVRSDAFPSSIAAQWLSTVAGLQPPSDIASRLQYGENCAGWPRPDTRKKAHARSSVLISSVRGCLVAVPSDGASHDRRPVTDHG